MRLRALSKELKLVFWTGARGTHGRVYAGLFVILTTILEPLFWAGWAREARTGGFMLVYS